MSINHITYPNFKQMLVLVFLFSAFMLGNTSCGPQKRPEIMQTSSKSTMSQEMQTQPAFVQKILDEIKMLKQDVAQLASGGRVVHVGQAASMMQTSVILKKLEKLEAIQQQLDQLQKQQQQGACKAEVLPAEGVLNTMRTEMGAQAVLIQKCLDDIQMLKQDVAQLVSGDRIEVGSVGQAASTMQISMILEKLEKLEVIQQQLNQLQEQQQQGACNAEVLGNREVTLEEELNQCEQHNLRFPERFSSRINQNSHIINAYPDYLNEIKNKLGNIEDSIERIKNRLDTLEVQDAQHTDSINEIKFEQQVNFQQLQEETARMRNTINHINNLQQTLSGSIGLIEIGEKETKKKVENIERRNLTTQMKTETIEKELPEIYVIIHEIKKEMNTVQTFMQKKTQQALQAQGELKEFITDKLASIHASVSVSGQRISRLEQVYKANAA